MSSGLALVEYILVASESGEPMRYVDRIEAIEGAGLSGDRYSTKKGRYSHRENEGRVWWVSMMDLDLFDAANTELVEAGQRPFTIRETRRNIFTRGFDLIAALGSEIHVGDAVFVVEEHCNPCKVPSELSGKENFVRAFQGRGGIRACVRSGGIISVGDAVTLGEAV